MPDCGSRIVTFEVMETHWSEALDPVIRAWLPPVTRVDKYGASVHTNSAHTFRYRHFNDERIDEKTDDIYTVYCVFFSIEDNRKSRPLLTLRLEHGDNILDVWGPTPSGISVSLVQPTAMELWIAFSTKFPSHQHNFNSKEIETWLRETYIPGQASPVRH